MRHSRLWVGDGGEGAKFWLQVLTEIKNRGVGDVCSVVCDGLKGLPEAIGATWPLAIIQTCVLHPIRNTFRLATRADWDKMAADLSGGSTWRRPSRPRRNASASSTGAGGPATR